MATEIKDLGLGQVDRLTLLDPGTHVKDYEVNGKMQQGFIHKVKKYIFAIDITQDEVIPPGIYTHNIYNRKIPLSLMYGIHLPLVYGTSRLETSMFG